MLRSHASRFLFYHCSGEGVPPLVRHPMKTTRLCAQYDAEIFGDLYDAEIFRDLHLRRSVSQAPLERATVSLD